jgi:hypothetical protein
MCACANINVRMCMCVYLYVFARNVCFNAMPQVSSSDLELHRRFACSFSCVPWMAPNGELRVH